MEYINDPQLAMYFENMLSAAAQSTPRISDKSNVTEEQIDEIINNHFYTVHISIKVYTDGIECVTIDGVDVEYE